MRLLQLVLAIPVFGLFAGALWFQFGGQARGLLLALLAAAALMVAGLALTGRQGAAWGLLALVCVAGGVWWSTIRPSNTRDWQEEVSRTATADIDADRVTVRNIRDFDWRTTTDYTPRWRDGVYELADLASVDLFTSVWSRPAIAHTLVSFGFADGRQLVFSGEIRKEKSEAFSEIGGFFRQFELALVAATEDDIVRTRIDARRETVSVYRVEIPPKMREELFLSLLRLGNELAEKPRFYHTVLSNCTTVVYRLVKAMEPRVPLDWRIVLSGHLPDYLFDLGVLGPGPLDALKARAVIPAGTGAGLSGPAYSAALRRAAAEQGDQPLR